MNEVDAAQMFERFVEFIDRVGRPEQTKPVIAKVRQLLASGNLPSEIQAARELLLALEQEALQVKLDEATLVASFGSE